MEVKKFIIKDVRCFEGETEFNIRPLTFLVGENSTGKSTALGCMQALRSGMRQPANVQEIREDVFDGFNTPPYEMGTFPDIARKGNSASQFALRFDLQSDDSAYVYSLTFGENLNGVFVAEKEWKLNDGNIIMKKAAEWGNPHVSLGSGKNNFVIEADVVDFSFIGQDLKWVMLWFENERLSLEEKKDTPTRNVDKANLLKYLNSKIHPSGKFSLADVGPFYSIAPVRSKPKRTYNPIATAGTPQGDEIPLLLMRMSRNDKKRWGILREWLTKFGKKAGMFDDIEVKTFSSSPHDPFQLHFTVRGTKANMADVGYGISQVLPILVSVFTREDATLLMQQPEVHLHPRAQAELLSVLAEDIKTRKNRYVLETHSDYMLDRARIEIMKGKLEPKDVSLIYLEPTNGKVAVHNITFDKQGNFDNAPDGYRKFFHKEANELLGFF